MNTQMNARQVTRNNETHPHPANRGRPPAAPTRKHRSVKFRPRQQHRSESAAPSQRLPSAPCRYRDALAKGVQSSAAYRAELGASEVQGPLSAEAQRLLTELYQPSVPTREAVRTASETVFGLGSSEIPSTFPTGPLRCCPRATLSHAAQSTPSVPHSV